MMLQNDTVEYTLYVYHHHYHIYNDVDVPLDLSRNFREMFRIDKNTLLRWCLTVICHYTRNVQDIDSWSDIVRLKIDWVCQWLVVDVGEVTYQKTGEKLLALNTELTPPDLCQNFPRNFRDISFTLYGMYLLSSHETASIHVINKICLVVDVLHLSSKRCPKLIQSFSIKTIRPLECQRNFRDISSVCHLDGSVVWVQTYLGQR